MTMWLWVAFFSWFQMGQAFAPPLNNWDQSDHFESSWWFWPMSILDPYGRWVWTQEINYTRFLFDVIFVWTAGYQGKLTRSTRWSRTQVVFGSEVMMCTDMHAPWVPLEYSKKMEKKRGVPRLCPSWGMLGSTMGYLYQLEMKVGLKPWLIMASGVCWSHLLTTVDWIKMRAWRQMLEYLAWYNIIYIYIIL